MKYKKQAATGLLSPNKHTAYAAQAIIKRTTSASGNFLPLTLFLLLALTFPLSLSDAATYYHKKEGGVPTYTNIKPKEKGYKSLIIPDRLSVVLPGRVFKKPPRTTGASRVKYGKYKYSDRFDDHIDKFAKWYSVDPELVKAIIKVESNFNPHAVSPKGAMGVMQLMPGTAKDQGVTEPFDPFDNIGGGVKYFRKLMNMFNENLTLALAGYNAGENTVIKYGYKVPPYPETVSYVDKVLYHYDFLKNKRNSNISRTPDLKQASTTGIEPDPSGAKSPGQKKPANKPTLIVTTKKTEVKNNKTALMVQTTTSNNTPGNNTKYTVQVASFRNPAHAKKLEADLKSKTYPVYVQKAALPGKGTWYRVRVGEFRTQQEASFFGSDIKNKEPEVKSIFVTLNN